MQSFQSLIGLLLLLTSLTFLGCDRPESDPLPKEPAAQLEFHGTIIALGDSLTAGLGVDETDAWPSLLGIKLQESGFNWRVINAGISGETSSGALARIKWIIAQKPEIVILETGANDALRGIPIKTIKGNISRAVHMLKQENITVILAGMQIVQNLGQDYTKRFAAIYKDIAKEQNCLLIPFFLKGVAGEQNLNQADSIHPNEQGHRIIVETVYPFIENAITVKQ